jgi:hypothetical protein
MRSKILKCASVWTRHKFVYGYSQLFLSISHMHVESRWDRITPFYYKGRYLFVWLFWDTGAIFSYLAVAIITGDKAANLDLCLALTAFSSESSFMCHTCCDTGPPFLMAYPKDPWLSLMNAVHLANEQSLPILTSLIVSDACLLILVFGLVGLRTSGPSD